VLATGSSTLAATRKFRDALTGRKREVVLLPVLVEELPAFGIADLSHRLLRGGLPQSLLAAQHDSEVYAEWMDSVFARDVQELFRIEKRTGFLLLLETLLRHSGGLIEVSSLAKASGLSRPTILNYLGVFETTHAIELLRPYHGGAVANSWQQPKVYAFDTGFVAHARGWTTLRSDDCGVLCEHLVLDTLRRLGSTLRIHFWRDKQQREIDFVVPRARGACDAIECKWRASAFDPRSLVTFRNHYPRGRNYVVTSDTRQPYTRKIDGIEVRFTNPGDLRRPLAGGS
jgi:hypothetical protein